MEETDGLKVKTTSMTDADIDWPLPNKILGCATDSNLLNTALKFA